MTIQFSKLLATYVESYNSRDVNAVLACFSETAVVRDEGRDHRGRKAKPSRSIAGMKTDEF